MSHKKCHESKTFVLVVYLHLMKMFVARVSVCHTNFIRKHTRCANLVKKLHQGLGINLLSRAT